MINRRLKNGELRITLNQEEQKELKTTLYYEYVDSPDHPEQTPQVIIDLVQALGGIN